LAKRAGNSRNRSIISSDDTASASLGRTALESSCHIRISTQVSPIPCLLLAVSRSSQLRNPKKQPQPFDYPPNPKIPTNGLVAWPITSYLVISRVMTVCKRTICVQFLHFALWFVTCILSEYFGFILNIMKLYSYRSLNIMLYRYIKCAQLFGDLIY